MLKIGILGVGAIGIGSAIATALDQKKVEAELVAVADQDRARAEALSAELAARPVVVSVDELIERSDLAVEAASANPRTSQLAAFSAIATLKNLTRSLRVGT